MSWQVHPYSRTSSFSGDHSELNAYFQKKEDMTCLLRSGKPEDIDRASEIAKTIKLRMERIDWISEASAAYAGLKTLEGYRKAYQLTLGVSREIDVRAFLLQLEKNCRELDHVEAPQLAEEIKQFSSTYDFSTLW